MALTAAIIVPTRCRAGYLDVALAGIAPQARAASAELIVIDDGPDAATRAAAERHGARYVAHPHSRGLNAARNTGIGATGAELLVFVDDDVDVRPGWLAALLSAAAGLPGEVGVLAGPIHARFEDHRYRACAREGPPISALDLGASDVDCEFAWGANMTLRRSALERAGMFDEARELYGDEQEWQARFKATGGRIRYVAAAALDHRRAGDDARLRALMRAAHARGRASRRFDVFKGTQPSLARELRVLAGTLLHGPVFRCMNGPVMAAHTLGRIAELLRPRAPQAVPGETDFLSGTSGHVAGRRGALRRAADALLDLRTLALRRRIRRAAAADPPPRRVLAIGIERTCVPNRMAAARAELERSRHDVTVDVRPAGDAGKFENLNAILADHTLDEFDWLLVVDDDVDLPGGFLDVLVHCAERGQLKLAQPAHRLHSHAAWAVLRRTTAAWRETTFVEIGPVTLFHRDTFGVLLPFPAQLRMGWGLDAHWGAVARDHGWPIGVVDAAPVGHTLRPAASDYPRADAIAEARAFLADRPYVRRHEVRTLSAHKEPR